VQEITHPQHVCEAGGGGGCASVICAACTPFRGLGAHLGLLPLLPRRCMAVCCDMQNGVVGKRKGSWCGCMASGGGGGISAVGVAHGMKLFSV